MQSSLILGGKGVRTRGDITLSILLNSQVATVWWKIVCSMFLPTKYLTDVTRDRVVLVYMLMKGMPINVGPILQQNFDEVSE